MIPSVNTVYLKTAANLKKFDVVTARATLKYIFEEVGIEKIITGAAKENLSLWKIMNRLGYIKLPNTKMVQYTFQEEQTEIYTYEIK